MKMDVYYCKEKYLDKVGIHINCRKVRKRVLNELSDHLDESYEDKMQEINNPLDAMESVCIDMGDPHILGEELKEANKNKIRACRTKNIVTLLICAFFVLISPVLFIIFGNLSADVSYYLNSYKIAEVEQHIVEKYNDNKPIKFIDELEDNGVIYRYYMPVEKQENKMAVYVAYSIIIFNKSYDERFRSYECVTKITDDIYKIEDALTDKPYLGFPNSQHYHEDYYNATNVIIYASQPEEKFIKAYYEPIKSNNKTDPYWNTYGLESYWSDFIEIPQNATYDNPAVCIVDCPDGYTLKYYVRYDENKNIIE